jgi:uncharacterized protein YndB with AHSA1/START domain
MNWTPPTGFTGKYLSADIRPGGESFYEMSGNVSRHPMAPTWPETMKTTVSFCEEGANQTRVTIQWEVYGAATPEEHSTFNGAKAGMTMGWTGSFDKLDQYLKTVS